MKELSNEEKLLVGKLWDSGYGIHSIAIHIHNKRNEMALEESIMTVREEGFEERAGIQSPVENISHNPQEAPSGKYFEYEIENVEWCCDKMREKKGTTDLLLIADRVEGEGLNRLWYSQCPYGNTPLVLSRTHLRIDNQ